jgi:hypothetical protein
MRGGSRPNAGRPRLSVTTHLLNGTFRASRHGPRPGNLATMPVKTADWHPLPSDLSGLGQRALDLLDVTIATYRLDEIEGRHLLMALRSFDRLDRLEQAIAASGVVDGNRPSRLLIALDREARCFTTLWTAALRVGRQ